MESKYPEEFELFDKAHWAVSGNVATKNTGTTSVALATNNVWTGIHEWCVKYEQTADFCCGAIGITTNTTAPAGSYLYQLDSNISLYHTKTNSTKYRRVDGKQQTSKIEDGMLQNGDIIKIQFNCDEKWVKFFQNEKLLFTEENIPVSENKPYRLGVCSHKGHKFTILKSVGSFSSTLQKISSQNLISNLDEMNQMLCEKSDERLQKLSLLVDPSVPCPQPIITIKNPLEAKMSECPRCCSSNKLDDNVRKVIFDPKFCDVVFLVGDSRKEFPVIRGYFAPHSTYFADLLFNEQSIKSKQIIEKDVSVTAFEFINKYCYRLYPDITVDNVVEVLFAAQKYELTLLITDCTAYINSKISNNNINEILFIQQKAIHFSVNIVIEQFNEWLSVENSKRILKSKGFTSLSKEVVMYLIQHNSFSVNESDIWMACKNWCEFQATTGEQNNWTVLMNDFTPHIRFTLMKQEFFAQNVYTTQVLTSKQFEQISLYFMNPTVAKINFITTPRINIYYGAQNDLYPTAQCLQYTLNISNAYECKDVGGCGLLNNYQRITNNDVNDFVVTYTNNDTNNEFLEAQFAGKVHIVGMDIGGAGEKMVSRMQWNVQHINGRKVEYKRDDGKWIDWKSFDDLKQNEIRTIDVDIQTTTMRILDTTKGHIAVGCWRFYGHKFITAQPELTHGTQKVTQRWDPINDAIKPLNNTVTKPSVSSITVNKLKNNEFVEQLNVIIGEKQNTDEEKNVEEILPEKSEEVAAYNEFDADFNENGYFVLSKNKKTATFSKIGLPGAHDYQYYPACKVSRPIDASDAKSQVVTFKLFQYGWFGIGSDTVTPHGFPGYTDSGWMIRVSNGGSYYNDGGNVMGANATGDLTNQMVTMKYDPGTQQLTVITESRQEFVYTHKDMPTSKSAYFVFTMASGKVQLFDTNE